MAQAEKLATGLVGAAGEYYVAAELSRRGWLATITIKNAKATDVLAQRLAPPARMVSIQTKTASPGNDTFTLNAKDEHPAIHHDQWFVFCSLGGEQARPRYWIVPHDVVSARIYSDHRHWLGNQSPTGRPRKDTPRRAIHQIHLAGYEDAWQLLEAPASEAPFLGAAWIVDVAREWGVPAGHPWEETLPPVPSP